MDARTEEHVARWPRGRPFRLLPRVRTLIDHIFLRHVVGVQDAERAGALVLAIRRILWTPGNPPMPIPGSGNQTLVPVTKALAWRSAPAAKLLGNAIEARRGDPAGRRPWR